MSQAAKVVTLGVLALLALLVVGYFVEKQVPSLAAPIAIETATTLADGGSVHVVLRDAEGRRYAIGVEGSLQARTEFKVYVQPWYSYLPVPIYVSKKSKEEKALLAAIEAWSTQLAGPQPGAELLSKVAGILRTRGLLRPSE